MDSKFVAHVESLRPKLQALLAMPAVKPTHLPPMMPKAGVYVLSEAGRPLYVGRSNDIRARIGNHSRPGATQQKAAFAFRLARQATGITRASYKKGDESRDGLMKNPAFIKAFTLAKARICEMELRYVEESDPVRQTLLEIYVAITLEASFNDFDNH